MSKPTGSEVSQELYSTKVIFSTKNVSPLVQSTSPSPVIVDYPKALASTYSLVDAFIVEDICCGCCHLHKCTSDKMQVARRVATHLWGTFII